MRRSIVILTKSKKGEDGYCVAGLDLTTGDWVRLNVAGEYSFPRNKFCFHNGQEIEILDTVSTDIIAKDNSIQYQPENYYCNPSSLQSIEASCEQVIADRVEKDRQLHQHVFYNENNRVLSAELEGRTNDYHSLMLIEPDKLVFRRNERGRLLAYFEYNGVPYRKIRVTDLNYTNSEDFPINIPVYAKKQYYLVMSLGEKFYNPATGKTENWKFAAAAIEKETIADHYRNRTISQNIDRNESARGIIDANEVVIKADQSPGSASFYNYDELKKYIQEGLVPYNNTHYSIDNVEKAVADLAVLKAVRKKLTDKRKELESAYTLPIKDVLAQLDSLIDMVKEPYSVIDKMLKNNAKSIKEREIRRYAYNKAVVLDEYAVSVVESPAFFNQRWKNVSYSEKNWKKDVDAIIAQAVKDIAEIKKYGGNKQGVILAYYLHHLSFDGVKEFIRNMTKGETPGAADDGPQMIPGGNDGTGIKADYPIPDEGGESPFNTGSDCGEGHEYVPITDNSTVSVTLSGRKGDIEEYLALARRFRVTVTTIDPPNIHSEKKYNHPEKRTGRKKRFCLTREEQEQVLITGDDLPISEIAKRLNNVIDNDNMKKISYKVLLAWLIEQEYIVEDIFNGNKLRRPTEKGKKSGIRLDKRRSAIRGAEYFVTLYSPDMQRIIIENVNTMV